MRLRAIALLAAALAALASGSVRAEPAGPGTFLEIRVCTYETFVLKTKRCGRDQRSDALVSSRFGCSVRFVVRRRVVFREVMRYAGARAVVLEATLGPGRYRYWMSESTYSRFPLPGGAWSCSYELGSVRASVRFRSGGPTGDIVNTAACAFSHALRDVDGLYDCQTDESTAPLAATDRVICAALYPSATNKTAAIEIDTPSGVGTSFSFVPHGPIWRGYAVLKANGPSLAPGAYKCRFLLDGELIVDKPFEIAA